MEEENKREPMYDVAGDLIITAEDYYGIENVCIYCNNSKKELNSNFCSNDCEYHYYKGT